MIERSSYLNFGSIRYVNNIPLASHAIAVELGIDYPQAAKFAEWHYKHVQHLFDVLQDDSRFKALVEENEILLNQCTKLTAELSGLREATVIDKKERPKKSILSKILKRNP